MVNVRLRPYQQEMVDKARTDWANGSRGVLLTLSTGGGKSVIVSHIVREEPGASCVIAHRQELVGQLSLHLGKQGVKHRILAPRDVVSSIVQEHRANFEGRSFYDPAATTAVAGVDTLLARADQLGAWCKQIRLAVIDEGHHVLQKNKWGKALAMFPSAKFLGVTATPERTDGEGLGSGADGLFDTMHVGPTMRELIAGGSLAEYDIVCPKSLLDEGNLTVGSTGDYTAPSMRAEIRRAQITGDVVDNYLKFARGKRGVTFLTDVEACQDVARRFIAAGVPAMAISAKTPEGVRSDAIRRFRAGELLQLVNVDILGEGVDVPAVEVISMARPTASLIVYMQQFGRCLRPDGNKRGLIIDHVGNVVRHGLPDIPRNWSPAGRGGRGSKRKTIDPEFELKTCTECLKPYQRLHAFCPHCGHRPQTREATAPEQVDGDLELLRPDVLDAMRKRATLQPPGVVQQRAAFAAGPVAGASAFKKQVDKIGAQKDLAEAIAHFAGKEKFEGKTNNAEVDRKFFLTFGTDVLTALGGSAKEMRELQGRLEDEIGSRSSGDDPARSRVAVA